MQRLVTEGPPAWQVLDAQGKMACGRYEFQQGQLGVPSQQQFTEGLGLYFEREGMRD